LPGASLATIATGRGETLIGGGFATSERLSGPRGAVWRSRDGLLWSVDTLPGTGQCGATVLALVPLGNAWFAFDDIACDSAFSAVAVFASSRSGVWDKVQGFRPIGESFAQFGHAILNGAGGITSDGATWTTRQPLPVIDGHVLTTPFGALVLGDDGNNGDEAIESIARDGTIKEVFRSETDGNALASDFAGAPGGYVAAVSDGSNSFLVISHDGATWQQIDLADLGIGAVEAVATDGNRIVLATEERGPRSSSDVWLSKPGVFSGLGD
jgi:hypothetical protein